MSDQVPVGTDATKKTNDGDQPIRRTDEGDNKALRFPFEWTPPVSPTDGQLGDIMCHQMDGHLCPLRRRQAVEKTRKVNKCIGQQHGSSEKDDNEQPTAQRRLFCQQLKLAPRETDQTISRQSQLWLKLQWLTLTGGIKKFQQNYVKFVC